MLDRFDCCESCVEYDTGIVVLYMDKRFDPAYDFRYRIDITECLFIFRSVPDDLSHPRDVLVAFIVA